VEKDSEEPEPTIVSDTRDAEGHGTVIYSNGLQITTGPAPKSFWQARVEYTANENPVTDAEEVTMALEEAIGDADELGVQPVEPEFGIWEVEIYDSVMSEWILDPATASVTLGAVDVQGEMYHIVIPLG
jgi:hypothetical protein